MQVLRGSLAPLTIAAAVAALAVAKMPTGLAAQAAPAAGPSNGTLIIAGGGRLGPEILDRFLELAGGRAAHIVVIPTAGEGDDYDATYGGAEQFRRMGAASVNVLHTRDPKVADTEAFVAPLREATGVWIPGGRQWRLADAYLGTLTLRELNGVLERGGVIGGSSAGASIQASYMVRGAVQGNTIMMASGHEEGFAFLRNAAIDQHLIARGRQRDLLEVVAARPELLGVGLDEGTAIEVRADSAVVLGRSLVAFYNAADAGGNPYYFLEAGDVFDLRAARTRRGERKPPEESDARAVLTVIDRLIAAIRGGDTTAVRRAFHADARLFALTTDAGRHIAEPSELDAFVARIASTGGLAEERLFQPEVRVDGDLASVWAYYEVWRDDRIEHCGTNAFHLARTGASWHIIDVAYTVRRDGCGARGR